MPVKSVSAREAYRMAYQIVREHYHGSGQQRETLMAGKSRFLTIFGNRYKYCWQSARITYRRRRVRYDGWVNDARWLRWFNSPRWNIVRQKRWLKRQQWLAEQGYCYCESPSISWDADNRISYCQDCGLEWGDAPF